MALEELQGSRSSPSWSSMAFWRSAREVKSVLLSMIKDFVSLTMWEFVFNDATTTTGHRRPNEPKPLLPTQKMEANYSRMHKAGKETAADWN